MSDVDARLSESIITSLGLYTSFGVTVNGLAKRLKKTPMRIKQHLTVLKDSGRVIMAKHGRNTVYRLSVAAAVRADIPFVPLRPRRMTTVPVREGGVIMPIFKGETPVWATGNPVE